jgi:hypothetical protein
MFKHLGAKLDNVHELKTSFPHPDTNDDIYCIFDVVHMVKLLRNMLGDWGAVKLNDDLIEWRFIRQIHDLQSHEGLRLANKLTKQHIEYKSNKMKVKYATQVFSKSVASSLCYLRSVLKLPDFEKSKPTEEFIDPKLTLFLVLTVILFPNSFFVDIFYFVFITAIELFLNLIEVRIFDSSSQN